ncbi:hypothetical protein Agub_g11931, partial [Astrephomene gubernaculifera]
AAVLATGSARDLVGLACELSYLLRPPSTTLLLSHCSRRTAAAATATAPSLRFRHNSCRHPPSSSPAAPGGAAGGTECKGTTVPPAKAAKASVVLQSEPPLLPPPPPAMRAKATGSGAGPMGLRRQRLERRRLQYLVRHKVGPALRIALRGLTERPTASATGPSAAGGVLSVRQAITLLSALLRLGLRLSPAEVGLVLQ